MEHFVRLVGIPPEIGYQPNRKIAIESEYIFSQNDKLLSIYSLHQKEIINKINDVENFIIINLRTQQNNFVLVTSCEKTIKCYIFCDLQSKGIDFNKEERVAKFDYKNTEGNLSLICQFDLDKNVKKFYKNDENCFTVFDEGNFLRKFIIFPDGIYAGGTSDSYGCMQFVWTGIYFVGLGENEVIIWDINLSKLMNIQISGKTISLLSASTFAVCNNSEVSIFDTKGNKIKNLEINDSANQKFLLIDSKDEIIYLPENMCVIRESFYLPMFISNDSIYTLNDEKYFLRLINIFPISVAIIMMASLENSVNFIAEYATKLQDTQLVETYLNSADPQTIINFLDALINIINRKSQKNFAIAIKDIVGNFCIQKIYSTIYPDSFSRILCEFRNILYPNINEEDKNQEENKSLPNTVIREDELLNFVLKNLEKNTITSALVVLKNSFHDFEPFYLFRTLVLQQAWTKICQNNMTEAINLIEQLGESPLDHIYEMWRQTTRNKTRAYMYDYLSKNNRLSQADEQHHQILLKITQKYPNTSFTVAQRLSSSPGAKITDDPKLPPWQPIVDLNTDFDEKETMIYPSLFKIPDEPIIESPRYFLGNIALIEAQPPNIIKMLTNEGSSVEKLWMLHCEHRVNDMAQFFKNEIEKNKAYDKLKCLKFINKYYAQMNTYELETLLDILCQAGIFAQHELDNFELLLVRICKNKFLFDQHWWSQAKIQFNKFFKDFARFCAKKTLFMPFEMFVISHPSTKEIDISDIDEPLIKFIWDLWVKRDPGSATLSCMQFITKSNSTDLIELWKQLPSDSLAPLASFVWNKDPEKFKPNSPETEALSNRLKTEYPLLSSLVKGVIPHPQTTIKEPPASRWRSPIYTSKYDLELHDLIQSHFAEYDFSKVFTDYYGKTPGQPPFPHFDHPELITAPSEPPYFHYIKSLLPVSAFQQAVEDELQEEQFKDICIQSIRESFNDKQIRLAVLSFIELTDLKFKLDSAIDYKMIIAIYDKLYKQNDQDYSNSLIDELIQVFKTKDQKIAIDLKEKLSPSEIEMYLLSSLIDVRCKLPLDYTPIINFAKNSCAAELLLFIDRAAEFGANYQISEVVNIVQDKMPKDYPLRAHLLFHLTQSLPSEEGPSSTDLPALVVFRAVRRNDQPPQISLLQEALNRKVQLYALLATSIEGADILLCAYVTMLTMTDAPNSFDVTNVPSHSQMITLFLQTLFKLLSEKKSLELMQTLELFSEKSIVVRIIHFYRAIELFAFRRAETELPELNSIISGKDIINDDLMGEVPVSAILSILRPMIDSLSKKCVEKSQIHVFRFLQTLENFDYAPPSLLPRIKLCKVISSFDNFRRAIVHCDLLGDSEEIVSSLVLNHSLQLGQAAAECLGISSASATKQWLIFQYSTAATPSQILDIHQEILESIQEADPLFFVYLFASLIPYAQPIMMLPIIEHAELLMKEKTKLSQDINALIIFLNICKDNQIEIPQSSGNLISLHETLKILFPDMDLTNVPESIKLSIASPVIINIESLQHFFNASIDQAIDICLDKRKASDAHLICEWRNRDPHNIKLLEIIQKLLSGEDLQAQDSQMISEFGSINNLENLLDNLANKNGWRFVLIALHYKATKILNVSTNNLLQRKTSEFIESSLSVTFQHWDLVKKMIHESNMSIQEVASSLCQSYVSHITQILSGTIQQNDEQLSPMDYSEHFIEFTKLCNSSTAVGRCLYNYTKKNIKTEPLSVTVNLLLHSSICNSDVDECAELFDSILELLINNNEFQLIINIISIFPDPALIPRYFQYFIAQDKLDMLPHSNLIEKVGRVIMNCARHHHPFQPEKYFDLTLKYNLYRDYAELQMESGNNILNENNLDKNMLQDSSRHFLLALAYFLHEKCYSLSMECLKKLSLISLQLEVPEPSVFHLTKEQVLNFMCTKEFPFALTVAVSYDMDTEPNWAEALFAQSVQVKNEDFLTAFQYFRPITSNLCDYVVRKYKETTNQDEEITERMKLFLNNIPNLVERFRIAKSLNFKDLIDNMKTVNPVVCEWCEKVLMNKQ